MGTYYFLNGVTLEDRGKHVGQIVAKNKGREYPEPKSKTLRGSEKAVIDLGEMLRVSIAFFLKEVDLIENSIGGEEIRTEKGRKFEQSGADTI